MEGAIVMAMGQEGGLAAVVVVVEMIASSAVNQVIGQENALLVVVAVAGFPPVTDMVVAIVVIDMEVVGLVMVVDTVDMIAAGTVTRAVIVVTRGLTGMVRAIQRKDEQEATVTVTVAVAVTDMAVEDRFVMREAIKSAQDHMIDGVVVAQLMMIAIEMLAPLARSFLLCSLRNAPFFNDCILDSEFVETNIG